MSEGLVFEFDESLKKRAYIDNPLDILFPSDEDDGRGVDRRSYKLKNGIVVEIQDLRRVHELQKYE